MNVDFTEEQRMVQQTIRGLIGRHLPISVVRELRDPKTSGHSDILWKQLAEGGWLGLAIPEAYGGSDMSLAELGILYEEAGRGLVPTTLFSTQYAGLLIAALGTEAQKKEYLERLANGELISTVAFAEPGVIYNSSCFTTRAHYVNDQWVLSGKKAFVLNAHVAEPILVAACTKQILGREGITVFMVPRNAPGVTIESHVTSGGDRQSVVTFNEVRLGVDAILGGEEALGKATPAIELATRQATALQCAEMVGGMQTVMEQTIKYVTERQQFNRPIGTFQAVQHHAANMATKLDGARLITYYAIWKLAQGESAETEVSMAKAWTSDAYDFVVLQAMQLQGGMGYATESDLFLWGNRAKSTELSFGTTDYHRERVAALVLDTAS